MPTCWPQKENSGQAARCTERTSSNGARPQRREMKDTRFMSGPRSTDSEIGKGGKTAPARHRRKKSSKKSGAKKSSVAEAEQKHAWGSPSVLDSKENDSGADVFSQKAAAEELARDPLSQKHREEILRAVFPELRKGTTKAELLEAVEKLFGVEQSKTRTSTAREGVRKTTEDRHAFVGSAVLYALSHQQQRALNSYISDVKKNRQQIDKSRILSIISENVEARDTAPELLDKEEQEKYLSELFQRADELASTPERGRPVKGADFNPKVKTNLRIDEDVIEWVKSKGPNHTTRINALLRALMEADEEPPELT